MGDTLFAPEALPITLASQIAEVEREIKMRVQVYPRRVASGSMTKTAADRQIEVMRAVLKTLKAQQGT